MLRPVDAQRDLDLDRVPLAIGSSSVCLPCVALRGAPTSVMGRCLERTDTRRTLGCPAATKRLVDSAHAQACAHTRDESPRLSGLREAMGTGGCLIRFA